MSSCKAFKYYYDNKINTRKITESESCSGLLKPLSLSHTHGATANLLYKINTVLMYS